jgi:hypothetical protein
MPKVINPGNLPRYVYRGRCLNCGCEALYEQREVVWQHYAGEAFGSFCGECPKCRKQVYMQPYKEGSA